MKDRFIAFFMAYSNKQYVGQLWKKMEEAYSTPERHYHTLAHLAKMLDVISLFEQKIKDREAVTLAVWFHDVVYDSNRNDNEERSAEYLVKESVHLNFSKETVQKALALILLTKQHTLSDEADFDTKLFLDADLVILGGTEEEYRNYQKGVRKEYQQYSDLVYKEGRKKVLKHFLESDPIYKTEEVRKQFEEKAKINLSLELKQLSV